MEHRNDPQMAAAILHRVSTHPLIVQNRPPSKNNPSLLRDQSTILGNCWRRCAMESDSKDVTLLLQRIEGGDHDAANLLVPLLYQELRRMAGSFLRNERPNHTLQATALVNEAYLKLVDQKNVKWQNRSHFFGVAAELMRRILVDYARSHQAAKRGGGAS